MAMPPTKSPLMMPDARVEQAARHREEDGHARRHQLRVVGDLGVREPDFLVEDDGHAPEEGLAELEEEQEEQDAHARA